MKDTSTGEEGTLGLDVIRSFLVHWWAAKVIFCSLQLKCEQNHVFHVFMAMCFGLLCECIHLEKWLICEFCSVFACYKTEISCFIQLDGSSPIT